MQDSIGVGHRPKEAGLSRLFLSHASANNAHALALARSLADNGWDDYFLDVSPSRGLSPASAGRRR